MPPWFLLIIAISVYSPHIFLEVIPESRVISLGKRMQTNVQEQDLNLPFHADFRAEEIGTLGKTTRHVLQTPRCGNEDYPNEKSHELKSRRKRTSQNEVARLPPKRHKWNKKYITYRVTQYTRQAIPAHEIDRDLAQAFKLWEEHVNLKFVQSTAKDDEEVDIDIQFVEGEHGDGTPFTGRMSETLGHAYPPGEGLGGDIHFNDNFTWSDGTTFLHTATHEIGHSLGLNHVMIKDAIMSPYQGNSSCPVALGVDDIRQLEALYGKKEKLTSNRHGFDVNPNEALSTSFQTTMTTVAFRAVPSPSPTTTVTPLIVRTTPNIPKFPKTTPSTTRFPKTPSTRYVWYYTARPTTAITTTTTTRKSIKYFATPSSEKYYSFPSTTRKPIGVTLNQITDLITESTHNPTSPITISTTTMTTTSTTVFSTTKSAIIEFRTGQRQGSIPSTLASVTLPPPSTIETTIEFTLPKSTSTSKSTAAPKMEVTPQIIPSTEFWTKVFSVFNPMTTTPIPPTATTAGNPLPTTTTTTAIPSKTTIYSTKFIPKPTTGDNEDRIYFCDSHKLCSKNELEDNLTDDTLGLGSGNFDGGDDLDEMVSVSTKHRAHTEDPTTERNGEMTRKTDPTTNLDIFILGESDPAKIENNLTESRRLHSDNQILHVMNTSAKSVLSLIDIIMRSSWILLIVLSKPNEYLALVNFENGVG